MVPSQKQGCWSFSFHISCATRVQPRYQGMDIIDTLDNLTPLHGDCIDKLLPYTRGRHNRQPMNLTYTEEVVGSSPIAPTELDPSRTAFGTGLAVSHDAPF